MSTRRTVLACALAGCLALAGCGGGGSDEERGAPAAGTGDGGVVVPPGPSPQPLDYVAGSKAALAGGAIAVVDGSNRVGVEPSLLDVNREQQLNSVRWIGWGSERATGRGDVRTLVCEPNCAGGRVEHSRGVIVLSAPKRCAGGRFYTHSSMTYEQRGRTRAPATYLRTPPC